MQQQRARRLGILGGMGPLATVDFMRKIIQSTPAGQDQAHIPMVVANVPQIPDRTQAILDAAEDPFPALLQLLRQLEQAGATLFVIPCNTAHFWFKRLTYYSRIEAISIIDCVVALFAAAVYVVSGCWPPPLRCAADCTNRNCVHSALSACYRMR